MAITTGDLIARRSLEVLKQGQDSSGAFVASPSFPTYRYAWLRDGAFCAYALDQVGCGGLVGGHRDPPSIPQHRPRSLERAWRVSIARILKLWGATGA